jgi:hypothetical protein
MRVEIVPMTGAHATALAPRLRPFDRQESESAGLPARAALWRCYRASHVAKAALVDGEVAACWGCCGPLLSPVGYPWLLTSAMVARVPVTLLREGRRETEQMLIVHPALEGYVLASYRAAIRFLGALGFTVGAPRVVGPRKLLFRPFELRR